MTLNGIITRAASVYPDCWILQYWDREQQSVVANKDGGDTLAQFIASELYETYDPDADDETQLETAITKMQEAADDLCAIVTALRNLKQEKLAS